MVNCGNRSNRVNLLFRAATCLPEGFLISLCLILGFHFQTVAQQSPFPTGQTFLSTPPHSKSPCQEIIADRPLSGTCASDRAITHVSRPSILPFLPDSGNGSAILVIPGGAYAHITIDTEGTDIALWLNSLGIAAFVLKYSIPDSACGITPYDPLRDAIQAMDEIRSNHKKYGLDTGRIGIMGFSAGGHLALMAAISCNTPELSLRFGKHPLNNTCPDFIVLLYPVVSMTDEFAHKTSRINLLGPDPSRDVMDYFSPEKKIRGDFAPLFTACAKDDSSVDPENSIKLHELLSEAGLFNTLQLYETGGHGKGICKAKGTDFQQWPVDCASWLANLEIIAQPPDSNH